MDTPLISVKNLSILFKTSNGTVHAVNDISFEVKKGEIFALVGESGSGKSTVAFSIMRLIPRPGEVSGGQIVFQGRDLLKLKEEEMFAIRGKEIGMIFQNPLDSLNPVYPVGNQISEALLLDKLSREEAWKKVIQIFKDVKIPDPEERAKSYPHELSGGMRQRAMIAMMLSRNPKLLIADEPTTALDVTIQAQILEIIKELRDSFGTSILIITHDFGIVAEIADRVAVMYAGKIVEIGDVMQIFENPCHPYTKLLMKALPRITKKEGRLETVPGSVPNLVDPPKGCSFHPRCPQAMEICSQKVPELKEAEEGHCYFCHLEVMNHGNTHQS